jgi:hypothetical protein
LNAPCSPLSAPLVDTLPTYQEMIDACREILENVNLILEGVIAPCSIMPYNYSIEQSFAVFFSTR